MEPIHCNAIILTISEYTASKKIVHLYTPTLGKIDCIVTGISSKKGKQKRAYLQPSYILQCVLQKQNSRQNLYMLKEFSLDYNYETIPFDIHKSSQVFFLCEAINKLTVEESSTENTFDFIKESFILLDLLEEGAENFHVVFLYQFLKHQGYAPTSDIIQQYASTTRLNPEELSYVSLKHLHWNRTIRNLWIDTLIYHIENILNISLLLKSLKVLKQIFN
ncbi:MAG: DNA repair protein RecO [Prolixibacteraceae bacterium]|jgi:DNA repair protein RecO (recombination protein O)|nr:DNA repair protein RecO [Prolixibacteraceae bacterium]